MCYLGCIIIIGAYCKVHNNLCGIMIMGAYCVGKVHNMLPRLYYNNWSILCR